MKKQSADVFADNDAGADSDADRSISYIILREKYYEFSKFQN